MQMLPNCCWWKKWCVTWRNVIQLHL